LRVSPHWIFRECEMNAFVTLRQIVRNRERTRTLFGFHINGTTPGINFDQLTCSLILTLTKWRLGMSHARRVRYPDRNQLSENVAVRNKMSAVISPMTRPRIHLCMLVSRLVSTPMVSNPEFFRCKAFKFRGKDFDRKIALQGKP
jgi:hypothetical protein